ncbi:MAG: VWA domain-containing protein [Anaerolineales bacterium]|nr:VWA domain-containing protein [Anaerolineales bacterium]
MSGETTYYSILGLPSNAQPEAVREAFASHVARFPSEAQDDPEYQKLLQAYEVLNDPDRRAIYDSLIAEMAPSPLIVNIQLSRTKLPIAASPQVFYLLVEVNPPRQSAQLRRPLNLCLVLDRSTSMQGQRLDFLKTAVELVVEKLAPEDVISIVTFSDRAEVVQAATHLTSRNAIISRVRSIRASGGTEIYHGLLAGVEQLQQTPLSQYNNHLILLTDGHTYGDTQDCIDLSVRAAGQRIGISAFGLGDEWNDNFLDKLVSASGGQSAFIEDPAQIVNHLQQRIKGLGLIHARNLRLKKELPSQLTLQYGFKLLPFAQPLEASGSEIKLGNIEGKGALSFLLELTLQPQSHELRLSIPLELTADIPGRNLKDQTFKNPVQILVTANPLETAPPKDLVKAVRMLNMYRMNEKVWEEIEAGNVGVAATRMQHLTTRLLEAGEIKLAQQAHAETERLTRVGSLSPEGWKRLKYGTRAMIGETVRMESDDSV